MTIKNYSQNVSRVLMLAALEARMARQDVIDTDHLLLAILHDEGDNLARKILEQHNMNYDNVAEVLNNMNLSEDEDEYNDTLDPMDGKGGKQQSKGADTITEAEKPTAHNGNTPPKTPVIDAFSTDLTKLAKEGKMDPVVGREKEIQRLQEILLRRKKNNPILIGEPGVGKSSIVEGLAQLIADNKVSPILFNKRLVSLDMASLVAGTKYRGQFEERLKNLIKELETNPDIICFIDEIHTIIGAGNVSGSMDAANMLKPALARGTIQCIGATTLDEYRKTIEKDGALERRFQKIIVEQTTPEETIQILFNIKDRYEDHHKVTYSDEALTACVKLTQRYVTDRAFPDKAIDAMDEVGAKMHLASADSNPQSDVAKLEEQIRDIREKKLQAVQDQNFELAANYRDQNNRLEAELAAKLKEESGALKGSNQVSQEAVADVVSMMTGVPVQRVAESEGARLRSMADRLKGSIVAQDKAIEKMVKAIQRNRVGLHDPNHPIGVFMFLGPTGVGKTYLAKKLAEEMFGSQDALIRIDMSEYSESFNTSRLVGAPPGYVGYEEGGQLTERVRRKPYSIVLLDEIEKANSNVFNMLLQVMDEGRLTDGNGRLVDFRNTIIIMTSNAGTKQLKDFGNGVGFAPITDTRAFANGIIEKALKKQFAPEFLNRLDEIIMFDQLDMDAVRQILDIELKSVYKRIENLGYTLTISDDYKSKIVKKGYDIQYGARPLRRAIQTQVEDVVCQKILNESEQHEIHLE